MRRAPCARVDAAAQRGGRALLHGRRDRRPRLRDLLRRRERRVRRAPLTGYSAPVYETRRRRVLEAMEPGLRGALSRRRPRAALERHPLPVPPGQRLPLPDRLRPSERRRRAAHRRRPALHALRRAARSATPRPGRATGPASKAPSPTSAPTRRTRTRSCSTSCPSLLERAKRVYHVLGRDARVDARLTEIVETSLQRSRTGVVPPEAIVDPRVIVHELRLFKEPGRARRDAPRRGDQPRGPRGRRALAREGVYEYELAAVLDYTFRRRGGAGPAYESIVGGGANATILHYVANDQPLRDGELRADRRRLRARRLRVGRDALLSGRRSLQRPRRATSTKSCSRRSRRRSTCRVPATRSTTCTTPRCARLVQGMIDLKLLAGPSTTRSRAAPTRPSTCTAPATGSGSTCTTSVPTPSDGKPRPLAPGHRVHRRAGALRPGARREGARARCAASACASRTTWSSPTTVTRT